MAETKLNRKQADVMVETIKHGLEERKDSVKKCFEYPTDAIQFDNIFSLLGNSVKEIEQNKILTDATRQFCVKNGINESNITNFAAKNDSRINSIYELERNVIKYFDREISIVDKLVYKAVSEIKTNKYATTKCSPSNLLLAINYRRKLIGLNVISANDDVVLQDSNIDVNIKSEIENFDTSNNLSNASNFIKKAFNYDIINSKTEKNYIFKNGTISVFEESPLNGTIPSIQALFVAVDNFYDNSFDYSIKNHLSSDRCAVCKIELSTLSSVDQEKVKQAYKNIVNLFTAYSFAHICFSPKSYKFVETIMEYQIGKELVDVSQLYDKNIFTYLVTKQVEKNMQYVYKKLKIKSDNLRMIYDLTNITFYKETNKFNPIDFLFSSQKSSTTEKYDNKIYNVNYSKMETMTLYNETIKKYQKMFKLTENEINKLFIKNEKIDNKTQNKKIFNIIDVINSTENNFSSHTALNLEQLNIVVDAFAYFAVAKVKLNEINTQYFDAEEIKKDEIENVRAIYEKDTKTETAKVASDNKDAPKVESTKEIMTETQKETKTAKMEKTKLDNKNIIDREEDSVPVDIIKSKTIDKIDEKTVIDITSVEETRKNEESTLLVDSKKLDVKDERPKNIELDVEKSKLELELEKVKQENEKLKKQIEYGSRDLVGEEKIALAEKISPILLSELKSVVYKLANKDLKSLSEKLIYSSEQDIKKSSLLLTGLNMLFNTNDGDKTVRNLFISLEKTQIAKNLILYSNVLQTGYINKITEKIVNFATHNEEIKSIFLNKTSDTETIIKTINECLINMDEKNYKSMDNSRIAEIDSLNLVFGPEHDDFEYEDEKDRINAKYYGDEEQIGKLTLMKKNLMFYMFGNSITGSIKDASRDNYKLSEKQLNAIIREMFVEPIDENLDEPIH